MKLVGPLLIDPRDWQFIGELTQERSVFAYFFAFCTNELFTFYLLLFKRPFKCPCGRSYIRQQHLKRHSIKCSGQPSEYMKPKSLLNKSMNLNEYFCPKCSAGPFSKKKSVWAHIAIVHGYALYLLITFSIVNCRFSLFLVSADLSVIGVGQHFQLNRNSIDIKIDIIIFNVPSAQ